ncbi:AAA family ATPase [Terasakiispira papahanaumokuakeensis]|uniref:AAA family ATPase n=1 Tax=Terasakiispira papahanaumokuakeensis TaxID=197479 RepID=A0A1E2VAQ1_9GAMM|nr:ATP-binding protein [Terasakiispira papahanaumokuakeensis]ODC04051.1 AAA family ATPase [Terasakiispira papahanaumokuakeensis]
MSDLNAVTTQLTRIANALESLSGQASVVFPDQEVPAYRWESNRGSAVGGRLVPIENPALIEFDDLQNIERQRDAIRRNTQQFIAGYPANNVLLTGARGTGKSSLVKACLAEFQTQGLRLIEIDKHDLADLRLLVDVVRRRSEYFILFCDDLSFEAGDDHYKALKSALDGALSGTAPNMLVYATSNRRHLLPEQMSENLEAQQGHDGEIHPGDTTEEKVSLSERFGLWLSFYPFSQDDYLRAVNHWLAHFGLSSEQVEAAQEEALLWFRTRGARSGRVAWQFVRDYLGRHQLGL